MRINLIVLRTDKPRELSNFYEKLEIQFEYHRHGKGSWHYSAELEGVVFEIYPLLKTQKVADKTLRLGFDVMDLDGLILSLEKEGVEIVNYPKQSEYGYYAVVKDLDGRKIELNQKSQK